MQCAQCPCPVYIGRRVCYNCTTRAPRGEARCTQCERPICLSHSAPITIQTRVCQTCRHKTITMPSEEEVHIIHRMRRIAEVREIYTPTYTQLIHRRLPSWMDTSPVPRRLPSWMDTPLPPPTIPRTPKVLEATCPICITSFKDDTRPVTQLSCHESHMFHVDCLAEWFHVSPTCPTCRK